MKKTKPISATVSLPDGPTMFELYSAKITALSLALPLPAVHLSTRIQCDIVREVAQSGAQTLTFTLTYILWMTEEELEHGRLSFRVEYHILARWLDMTRTERCALVIGAYMLLGRAIADLDRVVEGLPLCSYFPSEEEAFALLQLVQTKRASKSKMHVLDGIPIFDPIPKKEMPQAETESAEITSLPLGFLIGDRFPQIEMDYM